MQSEVTGGRKDPPFQALIDARHALSWARGGGEGEQGTQSHKSLSHGAHVLGQEGDDERGINAKEERKQGRE